MLSEFFYAFAKPTLNFKYFGKKDDPQRLFVSEIIACKKLGYLNA